MGQFSATDPDGDPLLFNWSMGQETRRIHYLVWKRMVSLKLQLFSIMKIMPRSILFEQGLAIPRCISGRKLYITLLDLDDTAPVINLTGDAKLPTRQEVLTSMPMQVGAMRWTERE